MQAGVVKARELGHRAIILVGDPPYYARVGFTPLPRGSVRFPAPVDKARILGFALSESALDSLNGEVRRARIDHPVCASSVPVGAGQT
jgi:predicted N-acetyltransferase YhbS